MTSRLGVRQERFNAFNEVFEQKLQTCPTYKAAYEAAEDVFRARYNDPTISQYTSWDSFKVTRSRILRSRTKKRPN